MPKHKHFPLWYHLVDLWTTERDSHQHQDSASGISYPTRILTRWEQLNYEVDLGSKEYLHYILHTGIKPEEKLYGLQWRVSINGKYLHKKIKNTYKTRHQDVLFKHIMMKKGNISTWNHWSTGKQLNVQANLFCNTDKHGSPSTSTGRMPRGDICSREKNGIILDVQNVMNITKIRTML